MEADNFASYVSQQIVDNMTFDEALNLLERNDAFSYVDSIDDRFLKYETADGTPITADTYDGEFVPEDDYETHILSTVDASIVTIQDFQEMRGIVEHHASHADTYMHFVEGGDRRMYRRNRPSARTNMIAVAADGSGYLLIRDESAGGIFDRYQLFRFDRERDGSVTTAIDGTETYLEKNRVPGNSARSQRKLEFIYENVLQDASDNPGGEFRILHEKYRPDADLPQLKADN
jgi:hypothetical protein